MKKIKRTFYAFILVAILTAFCGIFVGCTDYSDYSSIYDDDGAIISGNCLTVGNLNKDITPVDIVVSGEAFSGVETLYVPFTVSDNLKASIDIRYNGVSGRVKVVLADDSDVYTICAVGRVSENVFFGAIYDDVSFEGIPNGYYSLKIVGVKADFSMHIEF